jgi:hypothetical protein
VAKNIKKEVKYKKSLSYLQKDFESFRNELTLYARQHYSDKIIDFSESSLAGLFIDLAAYVGDSLSFYLDHQFNELFIDSAVESDNIERLIRLQGVELRGPSAALVELDIEIEVPSILNNGEYIPDQSYLPTIKSNSVFSNNSGAEFTLIDDVDFNEKDENNNITAEIVSNVINADATVASFRIKKKGLCTSAKTEKEIISIDNTYESFRTVSLSNINVIEVISIIDSDGNDYYEVESLTQDTVFKRFNNNRSDSNYVSQRLTIIPAPRRYIKSRSRNTKITSIRFGSGIEENFDDDIIPDPSLYAIRQYGDRKTFTKTSIDPNSFLSTGTLGMSPRNTKLTITYRHGGGLSDNTSAGSVNNVKILITSFPEIVTTSLASNIRDTLTVTNEFPGVGGENEPSINDLKIAAILGKTTQSRIVTREDLIARVYSMPANFGRVYRVSVRDNVNNILSAQLSIISRNPSGELILSPDSLKENLSIYLNQFRIISDNIDIVDGRIINIKINYTITVIKGFLYESVIQSTNEVIKKYFNIDNFQIDQPVLIGELQNIIINTEGVHSLISLKINNLAGFNQGVNYSSVKFDIQSNIDRGMLFPPRGGIFELKLPNKNIIGRVI